MIEFIKNDGGRAAGDDLLETAKAMDKIIAEQTRYKSMKLLVPVEEEKEKPALTPVEQSETGYPNEDILPDDCPIYAGYLYVCDGKLYKSDWHGITARQLKVREKFKEVRRCNITARQKAFLEGK